jgi:hypothetical protein
LKSLLFEWFSSRTEELTLFEDNNKITLQRYSNAILLFVQLTHYQPEKSQLQTWMRLGGASLNHFQGALSQVSASGELWLTQCLHDVRDEEHLCGCLESLLNQRDTWCAMVARLARPAQKFTATSLRSRPY